MNLITSPSPNLSNPNLTVLSDARHRQRVARSVFCPDGRRPSNQIQIECCTRDAPSPAGIPNWNTKASGTRPRAPSRRYLPLTAVEAAGFNPSKGRGANRWPMRLMSLWSAAGSRALSRQPKLPTPADASSWSSRRASRASAARRSGRLAGCSWLIRPSSAGSASRTATSWRCRTGWGRPASTAMRITGRSGGPRPMSGSPRAKSATGCAPWATASSRWSAGPSAAAMMP